MAVIGMRYPVFAPVSTETANTEIVYGTGIVIAKAIRANFTYNRTDNPLYADDTIAENDNGLTSYDIELEVDKLTDEVRVALLGENAVTTNGDTYYEMNDSPAPYGGFGFVRVLRENGSDKYEVIWCRKVQFAETSQETSTKGETIEWGTPTLNAKGMGVQVDTSGAIKYIVHEKFDTLTAALTWLNGKANITPAATT